MVTIALLLTGYCRTLSSEIERQPISRINRLTTVASTGRRMKRSVKFMAQAQAFREASVEGRASTGKAAGSEPSTARPGANCRLHHALDAQVRPSTLDVRLS